MGDVEIPCVNSKELFLYEVLVQDEIPLYDVSTVSSLHKKLQDHMAFIGAEGHGGQRLWTQPAWVCGSALPPLPVSS